MKFFSHCLITATVLFITTGCVQTRYAWQGYDQKLYDHYKNPAEYDQFIESLNEVIEEGESDGKVPPGIYAEYGYVLYEKGRFDESVKYFMKEQNKWPESKILMTKMINNAQKRKAQSEKRKEAIANNPAQIAEVAK